MVDLGQNLPDGQAVANDDLANLESIESITKNIDAIFYTHYHGDHMGLFHLVPDGIPQYIGVAAKRVALCKFRRLGFIKGREELSAKEIFKMEAMQTIEPEEKIEVGDIRITPYFVSHSAYESYMYLIEAQGKRILHTGDFRDHGYLGKGLLAMIKKYILSQGKIDILITEGTMLSRLGEKVLHENELKDKVIKVMNQYKNVFVLCSSTDLERLATFHAANKDVGRRPFVCDDFQKDILEIFTDIAGRHSTIFDFENPYTFSERNTKLLRWMKNEGFCMLVRATSKFEGYLASLESLINKNNTVLIYSMWQEYMNPGSRHSKKQYLDFAERFPKIVKIHTSGHASPKCLADVCNLVNPTLGIIPIHSEYSADYQLLPISDTLKSKIITKSKSFNRVVVQISKNERKVEDND